jgi:hypothetical protein
VTDQEVRQSALYEVVRAELDASLAFITGCRQLPRRQRRPRVGAAVRDYLADQIARKVAAALDGESVTVVPSDYFDELQASLDEPGGSEHARADDGRQVEPEEARR